ncbi:MAG: NAD/NADP-dependent betaine aldehyde dehydrogenase [Acidimicrobiales bacterium]|nr:NAD/NADP-dependent betaine aldehyde dehydrogenase [Acidimicrobiales bacterium]
MRLPMGGSLIAGTLRQEGEMFPVENPATGEVTCELPAAPGGVVDAAVGAARQAGRGEWGSMSPGRRQGLLEALAAAVREHEEELAELECLDNGVPLAIVRRFSVAALGRSLRYFAGWIDKFAGEVVPLTGGSALDYLTREPYGVVVAISAYNTPSLYLGSKVAPALAAGNTVVVKPSPLASLPALRFAELCTEAGLPAGTVNVVLGGAAVGSALVAHPDVGKIGFTGSRTSGREVSRLAAEHLTPVSLELGGKSPNIVFADADLSQVSAGAALGAFALTGQACAAGSRLFVHEDVLDTVIASLEAAAQALPLGLPQDPTTVLGPLISAEHRERVEGFLTRAVDSGAEVLCGGDRPGGELSGGYFLRPAVVVGATDRSEVVTEEIFGPVVAVLPFRSEEEVVGRANASAYGLAAGIWTRDLSRAHRVARRLEAGFVWVNTYGTVPHTAPFGGVKQSGDAREGSRLALEDYTRAKNVYVQL